jgi:ABC-type multidrug transport system ATPase subunit
MTLPLETAARVDPIVRAQDVWKSFGTQVALRGVDWTVPRGQINGLLGPNGAGKTTLFRLLMGILKPTEGSLTIEGSDCFEDRVLLKRRVGFLPDEPVFYNYLTGHEMLQLSLGMHGLDMSAIARLTPWVHRLGLSDSLHRHAEEYSRGMKKKLGLLMALLHRPVLLILDEPTNGLDVESTHQFFEMMRELACD